jgi:hypothetical protein
MQSINQRIKYIETSNITAGSGITIQAANNLTTISELPNKSKTTSRYINTQTPGSVLTYMPNFTTTLSYTQPHFNYITINITSSNNTGFICQIAGYYRIDYSMSFQNNSYLDRASVWTRIYVNNAALLSGISFCYIRLNTYGTVGTCSGSAVVNLNIGNNIDLRCAIAKNSASYNNDFSGFTGIAGSGIILTYLGA